MIQMESYGIFKGSNKKLIENTSGDVSKKMLLSNNIRAGFKKRNNRFYF